MTRTTISLFVILLILINGCVSLAPRSEVVVPTQQRGVASWYGEEFAGRTTANGEIFDPMLLTAAHRTFPFGTVVEVKNPKNGEMVLVRINDRGPFVGNRIIDLSYAAAEKIGLVKTGVGDVELRVLKVGKGDREAPAPVVVNVGEPVRVAPKALPAPQAPDVEFPLPADIAEHRAPSASTSDAGSDPVVNQITVVEEHAGVEVRKQVNSEGTAIINAPVDSPKGSETTRGSAATLDSRSERPAAPAIVKHQIVLQLGAFQSESNANELAAKAREVAARVYVEKYRELNRVRIGPFPSREAAVEVREKLDTAGISSIVVVE